MIHKSVYIILATNFLCCKNHEKNACSTSKSLSEDNIINSYLKAGAWKYHYLDNRFTQWIDKGIAQDSTIAYLWQQKALPLWKQHRYDEAIGYYEKATALKPEVWLSRLGYLKCVFAKHLWHPLH
ncbi:MAG: hypothetical protein HRT67_10250 [Flavobacteriaceae bacterium]|nr:hypothetical protein [Flavobacteriaceae bacterium]